MIENQDSYKKKKNKNKNKTKQDFHTQLEKENERLPAWPKCYQEKPCHIILVGASVFFFLIEGRMISIDWFKNFIYIKLCTFS